MRRSRKPIVIASRRSRLARIQAELVGKALSKLHPRLEIEYRWIDSEGDLHTGPSLAEVGGKGLFTRSLEKAVLAGEADLAVHSLKDMPAVDTPGLALAAVPPRADVRDCLITREGAGGLAGMPAGAVVGTSSPRRAAQVLRARPDVRIQLIRGNVDTRLRKVLDVSGEHGPSYDATLLAVAGLLRMGLREHVTQPIDVDEVLPAAGQGALGIQCRSDDHVTLTRCLPLNDSTIATAVHAERQVVAGLNGNCHSPISVLCQAVPPQSKSKRNTDSHWYRLRARVMSSDGQTVLATDETASPKELRRVVAQTVDALIAQNARRLLAACRGIPVGESAAGRPAAAAEAVAE
ncbi:hydroxymethylbilane synthase [Phycisphaerales bacterium AB-hyl4]|uniref:Hydroxymethylbilane synthase n=1 Tax=Natronomicrosphaera hydrolytica TaxID=3242702 RepID=A0ABV4U904_9BACT